MSAAFVDGVRVRRETRTVSADEWRRLLHSADILLVPVSFTRDTAIDVRLSLATKLLECLSTGHPVLVYGPPDATPATFCRRHDVGSVVHQRDLEQLAAFLTDFAANPVPLRQKAQRDRQIVRRDFSTTVIASRFQRLLVE